VANSTDVRAWARENGYDVQARGPLPDEIRDAYHLAHSPAVVPGTVLGSSTDQVTEADFPASSDDYPAVPAPAAAGPAPADAGPAAPPAREERRPREVKPKGGGGMMAGLRGLFGGSTAKGKGRGKKVNHPRVPLGDFVEETWSDLGWLAAPLPPLARLFELQAPYAGVVVDETVQGTAADTLLQPLARYGTAFRALNGLLGPPVFTLAICLEGRYVTDDAGRLVLGEDGRPIPDPRTAMMFGGLKYSLLQMAKVSEVSADAIGARAEASAARTRIVDGMIEMLFPAPKIPGPPPAAPTAPENGGGGPGHIPGVQMFSYPEPPVMDGTGADPGRMT